MRHPYEKRTIFYEEELNQRYSFFWWDVDFPLQIESFISNTLIFEVVNIIYGHS